MQPFRAKLHVQSGARDPFAKVRSIPYAIKGAIDLELIAWSQPASFRVRRIATGQLRSYSSSKGDGRFRVCARSQSIRFWIVPVPPAEGAGSFLFSICMVDASSLSSTYAAYLHANYVGRRVSPVSHNQPSLGTVSVPLSVPHLLVCMGAVLSHIMLDGSERPRPVAFASRTLTPSEKNYIYICSSREGGTGVDLRCQEVPFLPLWQTFYTPYRSQATHHHPRSQEGNPRHGCS